MSGPAIASLATVAQANVAEALREAGGQGVHAKELAKAKGVDAGKLGQLAQIFCTFFLSQLVPSARMMRVLALNHVFVETAPDVFAHNAASSLLDTGKSVEELRQRRASPLIRHSTPL